MDVGVFEDGRGKRFAEGFVEAEAAAVEDHLINILRCSINFEPRDSFDIKYYRCPNTSVQAFWPFVFQNYTHTVKNALVLSLRVFFGLQLSLQLQTVDLPYQFCLLSLIADAMYRILMVSKG